MPIIAAVQGYDLNIGVGKAQAIDVAGDRVHFITATDPFAVIELRPNFSQGNIVLKPGQGYRFAEQVQRWVVYNRGTVPLTGSLMIGTGDFFDQRISGTVDVIDGGKARTLGGYAFGGTGYVAAQGAGTTASVQLWNPAGSGKNVIVEQLLATRFTGVGPESFGINGTVMNTLQSNAQNKKAGGAVSTAQIRAQTGGGFTTSGNLGYVPPGVFYRLSEPLVIVPGYGLWVASTGLNDDCGAGFEFYEENA